jgi:carbohydrate kinase (thermoresistant glucokinase family)
MVPSIIIVMGVSGCGKSTVAERLARRLDWQFAEADSFHPAANVEKMRSGIPLTDTDRGPWLDAIAAWTDAMRSRGHRAVVTCSALKRSYRQRLAGAHHDVRFVYLQGSYELIAERLAVRRHEYMPPSLLRSQFEALEEPGEEEHPLVISIEPPADAIVASIVQRLGLEAPTPS